VQGVKKSFESKSFLERQRGAVRAAAADAAHTFAFSEGLRIGLDDIKSLILGPKL
jgi:hypothetical protein